MREGEIVFEASEEVNKKAPVFYNKERINERNLNVAIANLLAIERILPKESKGLDMLAGSGIRGMRLLRESIAFSSMDFNDIRTAKTIEKNLELNKLKARVFNVDAKKLLLDKYNYIDIDPFGSPMPYIPAAILNSKVNTVIAITATDLAALYGIAKAAAWRKYKTIGIKTSYSNEIGIRVLLANVERIANIYNFSIDPLLYFAEHHYIRVYVQLKRYKERRIGYIFQCTKCPYRTLEEENTCKVCGGKMEKIGPLWLENITNNILAKKLATMLITKDEKNAMFFAKESNEILVPWYFTTDELARFTKQMEKPLEYFINNSALPTPLNPKGFKTTLNAEKVIQLAQMPVG